MSKKHFIALADVMRTRLAKVRADYVRSPLYETVAVREVEADILSLADFCQQQNPEFKRDRWLAYVAGECGVL